MQRSLPLLGLLCFFGTSFVHQPQAQQLTGIPVAWMFFVDDLHLRFQNTGRLRDLVGGIMKGLSQDGDEVAIRTPGPSMVFADFGKSADLLSHIRKLTGNGLLPSDIINGTGDREVQYRAQVSLSLATAAAAILGQADNTRRALIYVSDGYNLDVSALREGRALAQTVAANGVRVFVIDGRIVNGDIIRAAVADAKLNEYLTAAQTSLRVIAEQSGGFVVSHREQLPAALAQMSNSMR